MPYRKTVLATNETYHIINRSVAKIPIFLTNKEHQRAIELINFYHYSKPPICYSHYKQLSKKERENFMKKLSQGKTIVDIFAFCLMPNHFHFLLKQNLKNGVSTFMKNFQNSYAKYFNIKYKRPGSLFQSMFKAVRIETDEQLLHVSRYIHLNPSSSYLIEIKNLKAYSYSSLGDYIAKRKHKFVNLEAILPFFKSKLNYEEFVFNQAEYQRELQNIKHLILEN